MTSNEAEIAVLRNRQDMLCDDIKEVKKDIKIVSETQLEMLIRLTKIETGVKVYSAVGGGIVYVVCYFALPALKALSGVLLAVVR